MLNELELQLNKKGDWHIGIIVNGKFAKYTTDRVLYIKLDVREHNQVEIVFLGRDHTDASTSDWVCKIETVFINQLEFPELIQHSEFVSDNDEYKNIPGCDYINLNGVWRLSITADTCKQLIGQYLNV